MSPRRIATGRFGRMSGLLAAVALVAGLGMAGCANSEEQDMAESEPMYSARELDVQGKRVVELARCGDDPLVVKIVPSAGANLISMVYKGKELIYGPENLAEFTGARGEAFVRCVQSAVTEKLGENLP